MRLQRCVLPPSRPFSTARVIVGIAALLMLVVHYAPRLMGSFGRSQADVAQFQLEKVQGLAMEWARTHQYRCPRFRDFAPDYEPDDFRDPWGAPITIVCDRGNVLVVSRGEDAIAGTVDDLVSQSGGRGR